MEGQLAQLRLRLALRCDVEQVALQVERPSVVVEDDHTLIANPDDVAVAIDQPVLETQRIVGPMRPRMCSQHPLAVIRVQHANEQVRRRQPLLRRIAEKSFDLRAREDVGARLVESVDVDHEWKLLDERLVSPSHVVVADRVDRRRRSATAALVHADWIDSAARPALPHKRDRAR